MQKTSYLFFILISLFLFSCKDATQEVTKDMQGNMQKKTAEVGYSSIVSAKEYTSMSDLEKEIVDMLNLSFHSLEAISIHNTSNSDFYTATFSIDKDGKRGAMDYFALSILSVEETRIMRTEGGCSACGFSSGISCAKAVLAAVDDAGGSLSVSITKKGDCYQVTW